MPWSQPIASGAHTTVQYYSSGKDAKRIETIYESRLINGWHVVYRADENGRLEITGTKRLGRIGKRFEYGEDSNLKFSLETTNDRVPKFKRLSIQDKEFVEIEDRLNRTTESYKPHQDYLRREHQDSSVLTVYEFLSDIAPAFQTMLNDKKIDGYISDISKQVSQLQPPHDKAYTKLVK